MLQLLYIFQYSSLLTQYFKSTFKINDNNVMTFAVNCNLIVVLKELQQKVF